MKVFKKEKHGARVCKPWLSPQSPNPWPPLNGHSKHGSDSVRGSYRFGPTSGFSFITPVAIHSDEPFKPQVGTWLKEKQKKVVNMKQPPYMLLLLSRFSRVRFCATPETAAHQAPPSLGFSRQEYWSGLPFPSPMHESEKWKWSCSVVSDS